eukprot:PhM_4_TR17821/c0_g1_i1/m.63664/K00902/E2.7.1.108; dolichol kinase
MAIPSERIVVGLLCVVVAVMSALRRKVGLTGMYVYLAVTAAYHFPTRFTAIMVVPSLLLFDKIGPAAVPSSTPFLYPALALTVIATSPVRLPPALYMVGSVVCGLVGLSGVVSHVVLPWLWYLAFGLLLFAVRDTVLPSQSNRSSLLNWEHAHEGLRTELTLMAFVVPCIVVPGYTSHVQFPKPATVETLSLLFLGSCAMGTAVCALLRGGPRGVASLVAIVGGHYAYVAHYLVRGDTFLYLLNYGVENIDVVGYMGGVALAGVVASLAIPERVPRIVRRKWFHYLAAFMFTAALAPSEVGVLRVSLRIALGLGVLVEAVRLSPCTPTAVRGAISAFLDKFADERDSVVIRTHMYLLLGCALPVLVGFDHRNEISWTCLGIAALGFADSTAAVAGSTVGRLRLHRVLSGLPNVVGRRSLEGAVFGCLASAAYMYYACGGVVPWAVVIAGSAMELFLEDVDNLTLPLLWMVLHRVVATWASRRIV